MADAETGSTYFSACILDINTILSAKFMFLRTSLSIVPLQTMSYVTGSKETKMAVNT